MSRVKEAVIEMINEMPDNSSLTDIMAELHFRQNVDRGSKELGETGDGRLRFPTR